MQTTDSPWRRLARRERLWWLLPVASTVFVVVKLWDLPELDRLDLNIYFDAVKGWKPDSIYDFRYPAVGLGFTYPPLAGLVLRPLTALPYETADRLWTAATALASLAFLVLAARRLPVRPQWAPTVPIVVAVCMLSTPVWLSIRLGQVNAFLALAVLADVVLVRRRWAGVLIGLSGAIKLTPMYGVLVFVAGRRWRSLAISVASFAVATLVAWAWFPSDSVRYWTVELFATDRVGDLDSGYSNSLRRLVALLPGSDGLLSAVWLALALAITVIVVLRARQALDRANPLAAVTVVMCGGLVVAPITWSHHLYFMLPAVLLLIGSGASMARNLCAAGLTFILLETTNPGQDPTTTAWRAVALVLLVLFLPIDQGTPTADDEVVADSDTETDARAVPA